MAEEATSGPITGMGGSVKINAVTLDDIRNWTVTRMAENPTYVSSSTAGYTKTAKGNKSWNGQIEIFLDQGSNSLSFDVGDLVDFEGSAKTGGAAVLSGEIRIGNIETGVDIEGNAFEGATISFDGHGPYTTA